MINTDTAQCAEIHRTLAKYFISSEFLNRFTRGILTRSQRGILSNYHSAPNGHPSVGDGQRRNFAMFDRRSYGYKVVVALTFS